MHVWIQPIVSVLSLLLTFFYHIVKDWGIAIILLTLSVRCLLFPLSLRVARQQVKQAKIQEEIKQLRERYAQDQNKLMQETMRLYQEKGLKPFSMFTTVLIQTPIFMGMYSLFLTHGAAMSSVLIPWVISFSQNDSWHILPVLSGAITFVTNLIPLTSDFLVTTPMNKRITMSLMIAPVFLLFMWKAPVALCLYWVTGSFWALMERGFYRTRVGKALLNGTDGKRLIASKSHV
jgi:YidC/Oxa1 family membrane protein insertase